MKVRWHPGSWYPPEASGGASIGSPAPPRPLAVATRDFAVFHDLVAVLREKGLAYHTVEPDRSLPPRVRVVITTTAELHLVQPHAEAVDARIVIFTDPARTVNEAVQALAGKHTFSRVVVGIDPGEKPGVAVIGDGILVATARASSPEATATEVERALGSVQASAYVVRIGHGAPTQRDRILRAIAWLARTGVRIEIVDESRSTPLTYRTPAERDTTAAAAIALARGIALMGVPEPDPSAGEVRDIQRKSRLFSQGELTISRDLAHAVAMGKMTLEDAVHFQRGKRLAT